MQELLEQPLRIAMWSGPRNISTALMRAFESRPDTVVCDEPFYAYYLNATGAPHPLATEIIAAGSTDWRDVAAAMTGGDLGGRRVHYQKQMTHHLLPEVDRGWLAGVTNCLLIRHPAEVIESYLKKNYRPSAEDLGFPQQVEIYESARHLAGSDPPVIDAADVLQDPRRMLTALCDAIGLSMDDRMLSWRPGSRDTDGLWGPHWYGEVYKTTGFAPYKPHPRQTPTEMRNVLESCLADYEQMYAHRLKP